MRKRKIRGAVMVEAALCLLLNFVMVIGGLEFGYYLYARQALVGAVREASRTDFQNKLAERTVQSYLIGLEFTDDFIDAVTVDFEFQNYNNPGPSKYRRVTATVPISKILLFGGDPTGLYSGSEDTTLSVTAYDKDNKLKKQK